MFQLSEKIPKEVTIAFSGGADSVFSYHFCKKGNRKIELLHINHNTNMSDTFEYFVRTFSMIEKVPLTVVNIGGETEGEWHTERYKIFKEFDNLITCHNKDDNIENIFIRNKEILPKRGNIIRPFLNVTKKEIIEYNKRHNLEWIEDPTNKLNFTKRNSIRNKLIPLLQQLGVHYDHLGKSI